MVDRIARSDTNHIVKIQKHGISRWPIFVFSGRFCLFPLKPRNLILIIVLAITAWGNGHFFVISLIFDHDWNYLAIISSVFFRYCPTTALLSWNALIICNLISVYHTCAALLILYQWKGGVAVLKTIIQKLASCNCGLIIIRCSCCFSSFFFFFFSCASINECSGQVDLRKRLSLFIRSCFPNPSPTATPPPYPSPSHFLLRSGCEANPSNYQTADYSLVFI